MTTHDKETTTLAAEAAAPARLTARLGAFRFRAAGTQGGSRVSPVGPGQAGGSILDQMACVYLDAPTPALQAEASRLILATHNGTATYSTSAPDCFMGDTAIRVSLRPLRGERGTLLLDISARLAPDHLTFAFIHQARLARLDAEPFWAMFRSTSSFVLTVAEAGKLDLDRVYVVKYYIEGGLG